MSTDPRNPDELGFDEAVEAATHRVKEAQAARDVEEEPRSPFLTRPPVVIVVVLAFLAVVAWNLVLLRRGPPTPTPAQEEVFLPISLLVASRAVEAFREEHGRLPGSLAEVNLPPDAFDYRVEGEEYVLRAVGAHMTEEYHSSQGVEGLLLRMGEARGGGAR